MKKFIDYLALIMIFITSGAIIHLLQEGGAHEQFDTVEHHGIFSALPLMWKIGVSCLFILIINKSRLKYFKIDLFFSVLLLIFILSSFFSNYKNPSFFFIINTLLSYLLINMQVKILGYKHTIMFLNNFFISILSLSIIAILLLPSYGLSVGEHSGKWQGVFGHKNTLGNFASLTFIFYTWLYTVNKKLLNFYGITLSVILTMGSQSSTSLGILLFCCFFYIMLRIPFIRHLIFNQRFLIIGVFGVLSVFTVLTAINGDQYSIQDKDTSFTGRNAIWAYFIEEIADAPLIGHGLDQFTSLVAEDDTDFIKRVGIAVMTPHNGFLDCAYSIGYVGLFVVSIRLLQLLQFKYYMPAFELCFLYLIYLIILNTFEARLIGFNLQFIMLMYIYAISRSMSEKNPSITRTSPMQLTNK